MCEIWLQSDGHVEKRGIQTDRPTDKGTLQLYIVDIHLRRSGDDMGLSGCVFAVNIPHQRYRNSVRPKHKYYKCDRQYHYNINELMNAL